MDDEDAMQGVEGTAVVAPEPDLSTFALRWEEALGDEASDEAVDFNTYGGRIGVKLTKDSRQCQNLRNKQQESQGGMGFVDVDEDDGDMISLHKEGRYMIVRQCYDSLYEAITEYWRSRTDRVLVTGNAGTGKSWFQPYVVRRLLKGYATREHDYLFVFRQVGKTLKLIDLASADVLLFNLEENFAKSCLNLFNKRRVLYMFEPEDDRTILPLPVYLPSLTTLSPYEERTHEYIKERLVELYFPCWTLEELALAATKDPNISLSLEEIADRFDRFGGIIRHVFSPHAQTDKFRDMQKKRVSDADLSVLRAQSTGIDSDPKAPGRNISGYILSYSHIQTVGPDRFRRAALDFTSVFVRGQIRQRMKDYSIQERIQIVVDHLNGSQTDRGGLHLQETVGYLLAKGAAVTWECKKLTDARGEPWSTFHTRVREVIKEYDIVQKLDAADKILVSTNDNFPLADIVFSQPPPTNCIRMVQVTWQRTHSFTVRALYMLREKYLRIRDTVPIEVYFVPPQKEDVYASYLRRSFLIGNVNVDFQYTKQIRVPSVRLQLMWQNTEVFVLRPTQPWIDTLRPFR